MFDEELHDGRFVDLMGRMNVRKRDGTLGIEGEQREACSFYSAFAMQRM
jgi:mRNA (guanine-N7-)-methyltransferase